MSITEQIEEELKQTPVQLDIIPTTSTQATSTPTPIDSANTKLLEDIDDFKVSAVAWAKKVLANDENGLLDIETREVKDLMNIVDTVEKSVKPKDVEKPTMQVNVLVQNLMEAKDDC